MPDRATRIDAHQHFWRYDPAEYDWIGPDMQAIARDFLPADLAPEMDAAGIDASIAVQARQSDAETDWLLAMADDAASRIAGVVGWVDLRSDALAARLEQLEGRDKLVGFRHVVQGEPDERFILGDAFIRGVKQTLAAGYAYDVLVFHTQAPHVAEFLERCGAEGAGGRFVLDHIAKPAIGDRASFGRWAGSIRAMAQHPGCYCKLSGMVTEGDWANWSAADFTPYLDTVLDAFGADRVMFGSDWPVCLVAGAYTQISGLVADYVKANCPEKEAAIFGENARKAYSL